jgi:hypothetical protein
MAITLARVVSPRLAINLMASTRVSDMALIPQFPEMKFLPPPETQKRSRGIRFNV